MQMRTCDAVVPSVRAPFRFPRLNLFFACHGPRASGRRPTDDPGPPHPVNVPVLFSAFCTHLPPCPNQPTRIPATACSVPCHTMTTWSNMHVLHLGLQPGRQWCAHCVCYATVLLFSLKLLGHGLVCAPPLCFPSPTPPLLPPMSLRAFTFPSSLRSLDCVSVSKASLSLRHGKIMQIFFTFRDFTRACVMMCTVPVQSCPPHLPC